MVESVQSICVSAVYACAAGVGVGFVAHIVTRGAKVVSGGAKCVTALGLAGSLIIGGMVVTSVHIAGAKTNDTQQVGGDLSSTNEVGQASGDAGTNGVEQVGGDDSGTGGIHGGTRFCASGLGGVRPRGSAALPGNAITGDDVERMFRVATTFDVNSFAEPTANAVTNAAWIDYGGIQIESVKWRM